MYFVRTPSVVKYYYSKAIFNFPRTTGEIFFTFDDGPSPESTPYLLKLLNDYKVKASFFCLGKQVKSYPALFAEIQAEGHAIGNHGFEHLKSSQISSEVFFDNVNKGADYVQSNLFRPPYGSMKRFQLDQLAEVYKVIMWDVMCGDFDRFVSAEKCFQRIMKYSQAGSIIVLHEGNDISKLKSFLPDSLQYYKPDLLIKALPYSF